jgi:hypothetical protein
MENDLETEDFIMDNIPQTPEAHNYRIINEVNEQQV